MAALRLSAVVVAAMAALAACAPGANPGRSAIADGVKFDYALGGPDSAVTPHTYHLSLNLSDEATGSRIDNATVAVGVFGPGYDGSDLINLKRSAQGYTGDIVMPQKAGRYRLTFQVNRKAPVASATAIFETKAPA